MSKIHINTLFTGSLDTFKAFDNLTIRSSGWNQDEFPASIWQILNHLIAWQQFQIKTIRGIIGEKDIHETDTWIKERVPQSETDLQQAVDQFKNQLKAIEVEILPLLTQNDFDRLKIIHELSLHLSFHLGEVVLIRRLKGSYPLPHQMKEFLKSETL